MIQDSTFGNMTTGDSADKFYFMSLNTLSFQYVYFLH
jgi:hypothetical protein